jgi:uncharacterized protein
MWAAAWKIGVLIADTPDGAQAWQSARSFDEDWFDLASVLDAMSLLGPPLLIGLPVLGTVLGLAAYGVVMVGWRFALLWRRKRRLPARRP